MLLIGNVNVENLSHDSLGVAAPIKVSFTLPRDIRKRHKLKLKHFGFHSGIPTSNASYASRDYAWTYFSLPWTQLALTKKVKEVQMSFLADGDDVMHDNVSTRFAETDNNLGSSTSKNVNYVSFFTTKKAVVLSRINDDTQPNEPSVTAFDGYQEFSDITVGMIETNANHLDVYLKVIGARFQTDIPNVRMDTISFILELV